MFAPTTRAVGQGARLVFVLLGLSLLGGCLSGGLPGLPQDAERTVSIDITDRSFGPGPVAVQNGETIRFVVRNRTSRVYDFTIGTPHKQRVRSERLLALTEAGVFESGLYDVPEYDAHNAVLVPPGATRILVWWFTKSDGLVYASNLPGDYDRGKHGRFKFDDYVGGLLISSEQRNMTIANARPEPKPKPPRRKMTPAPAPTDLPADDEAPPKDEGDAAEKLDETPPAVLEDDPEAAEKDTSAEEGDQTESAKAETPDAEPSENTSETADAPADDTPADDTPADDGGEELLE